MPDRHLFIIQIGPVQEFIATARRSRDLWFSSFLLSDIARKAAETIVELQGGQTQALIFPAVNDRELLEANTFNVPNKIFGIYTGEKPSAFLQKVEQALRSYMSEWAERMIAYIDKRVQSLNKKPDIATIPFKLDHGKLKAQLEDFLEIYGVSYVLERDESDDGDTLNAELYQRARQTVEHLMSLRKKTRTFDPVRWSSHDRKCSLCGIRETVMVFPDLKDARRDEGNQTTLAKDIFSILGIQNHERLCGVCTFKRLGARFFNKTFLSTSHVAALPLIERLTSEDDRHAFNEFTNKLRSYDVPIDEFKNAIDKHSIFDTYDGEILFEDRVHEWGVPKDTQEYVRKTIRLFLNDLSRKKAIDVPIPYPYYALLMADGDHMGKLIDALSTVEQHREFSSVQSQFAKKAQWIVKGYKGAAIYTGGDDVLAILPLHTALACARELSKTFHELLKPFRFRDQKESVDDVENSKVQGSSSQGVIEPSLSVGMVIAHHLEPFTVVLDRARQAEQYAKDYPGKNALSIVLNKRSGSERQIVGRWGDVDCLLQDLIALHVEGVFSKGLAYEWQKLLDTLTAGAKTMLYASRSRERSVDDDRLRHIAALEAKRILQRKKTSYGDVAFDSVGESSEETSKKGSLRASMKESSSGPSNVLQKFEKDWLDSEFFSLDRFQMIIDALLITKEISIAQQIADKHIADKAISV